MPPSPSLCHPHSQTPGPGHLPDAIPRGARRPGAKLAAPSRGAVPSSSSFLPSLEPVAAASGTRVSRLGSRAERRAPGAPRPPAGRVRAAGVSSHPPLPVAGGPGSAPPPPLARSSSPGRRRCPAPGAPVRAGQPGARAASAGPSGREWTEGKKPGGVGERREKRRAPQTPRPAPRALAASGDARAATGRTSGSPCPGGEYRPPRQSGQQRGRRERGGGRGQAAERLPPRGRASWLRLGARRPAASRLRGEFGWSGRRGRGGAGSPGARESGTDEENVEEGAGRRQPGLQLGASPPQEPRRRGDAAV